MARIPTRFNAPQLGKKPMSKIGPTEGILDRNQATTPPITGKPGDGEIRTSIYTYFTSAPIPGQSTPILYNGDRLWARVTLTLETAGPVAVSDKSAIAPVLSGKGALLTTNVPQTFTVARGNKLYIASTGVNRVKVELAPVPWLEQIAGLLMSLVDRVADRAKSLATGK